MNVTIKMLITTARSWQIDYVWHNKKAYRNNLWALLRTTEMTQK